MNVGISPPRDAAPARDAAPKLRFLHGTEALALLPVLQRQRDLAAGLNTAGFVSGYRGSPLGGLDQTLWRRAAELEGASCPFRAGPERGPGRDLGVGLAAGQSVQGRALRRRFRHVVRQGPRRRPHDGRAETRQRRWNLALRRRARGGRRRPRRPFLDPAAPERTHVRRGDDPGAQPVERAGICSISACMAGRCRAIPAAGSRSRRPPTRSKARPMFRSIRSA